MKKLLPQANTLATVIKTFIYVSNKENCSLHDVAQFCGFEVRQASYYCNACYYLGLLNEDLKSTDLGLDILTNARDVRRRVYELIVNDELIGKIFAKRLLYGKDVAICFGIDLIRNLYPDYSNAVIDRRAKSLVGWCEEIIRYINSA